MSKPKDLKFPFQLRLAWSMLLPAVIVGFAFSILSTYLLAPSLISLLEDRMQADLKLATDMGMRICEESFNDLLEMRLEKDPEMIATARRESVNEIKSISKKFHEVHMLIIEDNRTLLGSSLDVPPGELPLPLPKKAPVNITDQSIGGEPAKIYYQYFPLWKWHIVSFAYDQDFLAPILLVRRMLYMGTFSIMTVLVLTVFLVFRWRVNKPLNQIIMATRALAQCEFKTIEVTRRDEIAQVALAFNSMVGSLQQELLERQKAEDALRDSEEHYRMVGEYNYDWEYWISPTGTLIYISPSCQRITGFTPEEFIANPRLIVAIVQPEDQEMMAAHLQETMEESLGFCELEFRIITKDGEERWLRHVCQSVYRDQNIWVGRRASNRDITKRKEVEETLRNTLDYLENIFANSADGIGIVDQDGKFSRWNKAAEEIYGYTFEELKGRSTFNLYADPGELDVMLKQLRQHGFIINYEINMKKKDGSVFPASLSIKVLLNSDNKVIGSITGSRDLSATKLMMTHLQKSIYQHEQARQALLESEQKLVNIIDFLPDATFVIDTKGKVIAWNMAIEDMTGVKKQDMVGKGNYAYALLFYEERRPILIDLVLEPEKGIERYDEVKREDRVLMAVAHLPNFRGKETYLFGKASALIDSHGNIIGSIETIRDITALRKAETDRLQFSKLESMSILAGGIAHDFNNILTIILGNIDLAMLNRKLGEEEIESLVQAEKACFRAQELSGQLLTFAKGGAPIKKVISLAKLVSESGKLALAGSKSRCEFSIPEDLWSVEADEGQINQVINNFLINADQSMPSGGVIKIEVGNIVVEEGSELPLSERKYVKLTITDQGIGIPTKYLDKIFDPYFTTKQKGSGLGLATAYSIIKNHSGHIKVESQFGVGTTFEVFLPAIEAGTLGNHEEPVLPIIGQGRILVMDDDEKVREVLCRMLSKLGYEVDSASDGSQALEKFVKAKESGLTFDAVILDLTVPGGMGGKESIEKLLRIDPQIKAIVSSGYSDDPIMANFKKYGFSEVIAKPYRVVELSKILQRVISK